MCNLRFLRAIGGMALLWSATELHAEERDESNAPTLVTKDGASVTVGAGVMGFADNSMRDFADVGGGWEARVVYGTRSRVAVEAAYTGGAAAIDALGLDSDATLLSNGAEVMGRVNLLNTEWQPYVIAGIGWRHYSVVNSDTSTSSVADDEDVGEVPMGAGVSYRYRGLVVDARGLFRAAFNDDLIATQAGQEKANLHSWQAQVTAGWEF